MFERTVVVRSASGLHARPAALFVKAAGQLGVPVRLRAENGRTAEARSILAVLALRVHSGEQVTLLAEGEGARAAVDTLAGLLESDLDASDAA
jgi:phosphocarrier protein